MTKTEILFHKDELESIGIEIVAIEKLGYREQIPHRDDHFMLIIQKKGNFVWELDFREVVLSGASACYVAAGQVHRYLSYEKSEGWFIFIETALISKPFLEILNTYLNSNQAVPIQNDHEIFKLIPVFESVLKNQTETFKDSIVNGLTDSLMGLFIQNLIKNQKYGNLIGGQKYKTVIEFKQLIQNHFKKLKQVKEYASLLNITPLYLNEVVKEITGFSASHWIQQEIILEAQRLLYYTNLDIKQIAFQLGYDDHAYFSRFFKKNTGNTASQFRERKPLFVQS